MPKGMGYGKAPAKPKAKRRPRKAKRADMAGVSPRKRLAMGGKY